MGYHLKLYKIEKKAYDVFDFSQSYDDVQEKFSKVSKYEFELSDFLEYSKINKIDSQLGDVYLITEEMFPDIIKQYCEHEKDYYSKILEEKDEALQNSMMYMYFKNKLYHFETWKHNINLKKDNERLTNGWRFEYDLIDLIRIYKTFDFENNVLVCVGS